MGNAVEIGQRVAPRYDLRGAGEALISVRIALRHLAESHAAPRSAIIGT